MSVGIGGLILPLEGEGQGVSARTAFDHVKSRVEVIAHDDEVIARTTVNGVITFTCGDAIVALISNKTVVFVGADDGIRTFPALMVFRPKPPASRKPGVASSAEASIVVTSGTGDQYLGGTCLHRHQGQP